MSGREPGEGGITGSRLTTYKYDSDNRLTEERDSAGSLIRYEYDGNGNQIKKTYESGGVSDGNGSYEPNGTLTLGIYETAESKYKTEERKYDGFNQLTEVKGAANVRYGYRPDGLRLSKDAGNEHTDYIWNGSQIMAEVKNGAVERTRVYSYGLRRTKSTVWGQPESYYVYNAHGDVVQLTGPVGYENYDPDADNYVSKNLLKTYEYDAFGDETGKEDSDTNPFRYCGEYYDAETESIYLRARNYDPGTGRFTSEDPARDGLNWYAYCDNNPVMFIDPMGESKIGDEKLNAAKQKILNGNNMDGNGGLSQSWKLASPQNRESVEKTADFIRDFNDYNINRIVIVVNKEAAGELGHTATMLINEKNQAILFSYYASVDKGLSYVPGQTRIAVYNSEEEYKNVLYHKHKDTNLITNDGYIKKENYDEALCLTINYNQGKNAFNKIADMYANPGTYKLDSNNCDTHTYQIMMAADKFYDYCKFSPNESYSNTWIYYNEPRVWKSINNRNNFQYYMP